MSIATGANLLAPYAPDSTTCTSPAGALTTLYDQLLLDLRWAERCQELGEWTGAIGYLLHAQDILTQLATTLKPNLWSGGPALMSLHHYVLGILRTGNAWRDIEPTREAIKLLEPLRTAWHTAHAAEATEPASARLSAVG